MIAGQVNALGKGRQSARCFDDDVGTIDAYAFSHRVPSFRGTQAQQHRVRSAQRFRARQPLLRSVHHHDLARATKGRDQHGRKPDRSCSLHHDGLAQTHRPAAFESAQHGRQSTAQGGNGLGIGVVRQLEKRHAARQPGEIGVASPIRLLRILEELRVLARRLLPNRAGMAAVTECDRRPANKVPCLYRNPRVIGRNARAERFKTADPLVAKHNREWHLSGLAGDDVHVTAANAADDNADQGAARLRCGNRDVPCLDAVAFDKYRCPARLHSGSPLILSAITARRQRPARQRRAGQ